MADIFVRLVTDGVAKAANNVKDQLKNIADSGDDATKSIDSLSKGLIVGVGAATAFTAATFAVIGAVSHLAREMDALQASALRLNLSPENYQALSQAANLSGTNIDTLSSAMDKLTNAAGEVAAGNKGASDTFKKLGISIYDASGNVKDNHTLLLAAADGLKNVENETTRLKLAQDLFHFQHF